MGPASKTSRNTSSRGKGEVDTVVKLEPKIMTKGELTGGNKRAWEKENHKIKITILIIKSKLQ